MGMQMDGVAGETSEYLCTLQLPEGSRLAHVLNERRTICTAEMGPDDTVLYPPHVTVTGFFVATPMQARQIVAVASKLVCTAAAGAMDVEMRRVVSTDDGHVLLDVVAPGVASLAMALAAEAKQFGVLVRPKNVRHLSLAKRRSAAERERIVQLYSSLPLGACSCELVVSQLLHRSTVDKLRLHGEAHAFSEMLRVHLPATVDARLRNPACISTPLRKRPSEPRPADEDAIRRKLTPPKLPKDLVTRCCAEEVVKVTPLDVDCCGQGAR